jgi:hypothetical protein
MLRGVSKILVFFQGALKRNLRPSVCIPRRALGIYEAQVQLGYHSGVFRS